MECLRGVVGYFFKIFIVMGLLKKGLTSFDGHGGVDMYGCTPEERHISRL